MKIYNYHPVTCEFISEGEADKDQLVEGNWLIPAYATSVKPIKQKKSHALVFKSDKWHNIIDNRGKVYWLIDGSEHTVTTLGEELPEGALDEKPVIEPEPLTPEEIEQSRAVAYSDPQTGSDRYFLEAIRKRVTGDEDGAIEAETLGVARVEEIKRAIQ